MANYGFNTPSYGYQTVKQKAPVSPYYQAATMQAAGGSNAAPFNSLASGSASSPGTQPAKQAQGYVDAAGHPIAQSAIDASLKANPNASKGGYEGTTPMVDPSQIAQGVAYDPSADPVLQQILATGVTSRQGAEAGALAAKKQLALQYGDTALANQIGDTATAQAAGANPYGVFNQLKRNYDQTVQQADQGYNASNLFYSGARELGQGQLADTYGSNVAQQTAAEQQALGGVEQNRLAQILGANQADIGAKSDATNRALQIAQQNGWSFGGWDSQGNPIFNKPGDTTGSGQTTTQPPDTSSTSGAATGPVFTPSSQAGWQTAYSDGPGGSSSFLTPNSPAAWALWNRQQQLAAKFG